MWIRILGFCMMVGTPVILFPLMMRFPGRSGNPGYPDYPDSGIFGWIAAFFMTFGFVLLLGGKDILKNKEELLVHKMKPKFYHDCYHCTYLGPFNWYTRYIELYHCSGGGVADPCIVGREGDSPTNFVLASVVDTKDSNAVLREGAVRAVAMGFTETGPSDWRNPPVCLHEVDFPFVITKEGGNYVIHLKPTEDSKE